MLSTFSIRALKILIIITIFPFGQFLHLCHNWFWCSFLFFWLCFFFSFHYALSGFWSWPWCNRRRRQRHPTPVLLPGKSHARRSLVGCSPWGGEESDTTERLHFHFHALEKEMATHSTVLAWRIPGTGEPGELPSMGSHRVGYDWRNLVVVVWCNRIIVLLWGFMLI